MACTVVNWKCLEIEFSQNFNAENMDHLESVKSIAKSNFKVCLKENIQRFHGEEILQIFYTFV